MHINKIWLYLNCPNVKNFLAAEKLVNIAVIIAVSSAGRTVSMSWAAVSLSSQPGEYLGASWITHMSNLILGQGIQKTWLMSPHNSAVGKVKVIRMHYSNTKIRCQTMHKTMSAYNFRVQPEIKLFWTLGPFWRIAPTVCFQIGDCNLAHYL